MWQHNSAGKVNERRKEKAHTKIEGYIYGLVRLRHALVWKKVLYTSGEKKKYFSKYQKKGRTVRLIAVKPGAK